MPLFKIRALLSFQVALIKFDYSKVNETRAHSDLIRIGIELFHGERMSGTKPVKCQKCGKPVGYITVFAKGLILSQPIQNAKIVAICMECFQKGK